VSVLLPTSAAPGLYADLPIVLLAEVADDISPVGALTLVWQSDLDGVLTVETDVASDGAVSGSASLSEGSHVLSLSVTDESDNESSDSVAITVGPTNRPPECSIDSPLSGDSQPDPGDVSFSGTVSDPDVPADWLTLELRSDIDGVLAAGMSPVDGQPSLSTSALSDATHRITLLVTDELGMTCETSILYTIGTPPTLILITPADGSSFTQGQPIVFEAHVSDGEDLPQDLVFSWVSNIDGEFSDVGANAEGVATFTVNEADAIEHRSQFNLSSGDQEVTVTASDGDGYYAQGNSRFDIDDPPTQPEVQITPDPATTDEDLSAVPSGSVDPEGETVAYSYLWFADNRFGAISVAVTLPASETEVGQTYTVEVTPWDTGGNEGEMGEASITISNRDPSVDSVAISPASGITSSSALLCEATGSDPDGETPEASFEWTLDSSGELLGTQAQLQLVPGQAPPGDQVRCEVVATDSQGATDSASVAVTIENTPPSVTTVEVTPLPAFNGAAITCLGSGEDPDTDTLTFSYEWTDIAGAVLGNLASLTLDPSTTSPGAAVVCTAIADDGNGGTAQGVLTVTVANTPPTVDAVAITAPGAYLTSETVTCVGTASDVDGGSPGLSYTWFRGNGMALGASDTLFLDPAVVSPGQTVVCEVTATDGDSGVGTGSLSFQVENSAPVVTSVDILPLTGVTTSAALSCNANATDADGGAPTITYLWTNDSAGEGATLGAGASLTLNPQSVQPGDDVVCTATAIDTHGGLHSSTATVLVENTDPVLSGGSIEPSSEITTATTVTCTASATDADGGNPSVTYEWRNSSNGGAVIGSGSSLTLDNTMIQPGQTLRCAVSVSDGDGGSAMGTLDEVVVNLPPEIQFVTISPPSNLTTSSSLSCGASATDPDGTSPSLSYVWFREGNQVGTSASLALTPSTSTPGDEFTCTVVASDGSPGGDEQSLSVTVQNTLPVISSVTVTPAAGAFNNGALDCAAVADDADTGAPSLGYVWTNESTGATLGSNSHLVLLPSIAQPDDPITCRVFALDPHGGLAELSDWVPVLNRAPSVDWVTVSPPTAITTGSSLSCAGGASDPDMEPLLVTYQWTNDSTGLPLGVSGSPDLTLSPGVVQPLETISCQVTAEDGLGVTDLGSISVGIDNTDPTVLSVDISSLGMVTTSSTLTCAGLAEDLDGGLPSLTYSWTNLTTGGSFPGGATLGLSPSSSSPGDVIRCTLDATDLHGGSVSANTQVTVYNTGPVVENVSLSPAADVTTSESLTCVAVASDPDGSTPVLSYEWTAVNSNGSSVLGSSSGLQLTPSSVAPGDEVVCTATATDSGGVFDTGQISVVVVNSVPSVTSVVVSSAAGGTTSDLLTCSASATDPDGGSPTLTYSWANEDTGAALGTGTSLLLSPSFVSPGDVVVCAVLATDSLGALGSGDDSLSVVNSAPTVDAVVLAPNSGIGTSSTLFCGVGASDPDGAAPAVTISWVLGGQPTSTTGATFSLTPATSMPGQTLECAALATDAMGASATGSAQVILGNAPPVLESVAISPASPVTTSTALTCAATWSDADDSVTPNPPSSSLNYAWKVDGQQIAQGLSLQLNPSWALPGHEIECTATVTDPSLASDSASISVTVSNSDPVVSNVTISSVGGDYNDSTLTCSATASDPDGGSPTLSYAFTNDATGALLGETAVLVLTPSLASSGDTIVCTATATDDESPPGVGTGTLSLVLGNRAPSFSSGSITPDSGITTSSELLCSASATDPDGDVVALSYSWSVDGVSLGVSGTQITLTPAIVSPFDVVSCDAIAQDTGGLSVNASLTVAVENTAPLLTGGNVTPPSGIFNDSTVVCAATATDVDGDTLSFSYQWTRQGNVASTTATLDLGAIGALPLDTYACEAEVDDGNGGQSDGTLYIVVQNRAPTVGLGGVSPSLDATIASLLTCNAMGSDADGETPSMSYSWADGAGNSLGQGSSLDVTPLSLAPGDLVACTTTATDTAGATGSRTWSVTLVNSAPTIAAVDVTPDPAAVGDTLSCSWTGYSDLEGDPDQSIEAWFVNGWSYGNSSSLPPLGDGDVVMCSVTPYDGYGYGSPVWDSVLVVPQYTGWPTFEVLLSEADVILEGIGLDDRAGTDLSFIGDVDGDGLDDIALTAPSAGHVYILLGSTLAAGGTIGLANADYAFLAAGVDLAGNIAERNIVKVGDVDGDGLDDILLADESGTAGNGNGRVYLFLGGSLGDPIRPLSDAEYIFEPQDGRQLNPAIAAAGDVDDDGLADFWIPYNQGTSSGGHGAYLILGASLGSQGTEDVSLRTPVLESSSYSYSWFWAFLNAGDLDGDAQDDLVIGWSATERPVGGLDMEGLVFVVSGADLSLTSTYELANARILHGDNDSAMLGLFMAAPGDLDGDGLADIVVNADEVASVFVFSGASLAGLTPGTMTAASVAADKTIGHSAGDFGSWVTSAGDIDRDGLGDVIMSGEGGSSGGEACLFLGSTIGSAAGNLSEADAEVCFVGEGLGFVDTVAGGGDVNGDGQLDLLIADPYLGSGRVYLMLSP